MKSLNYLEDFRNDLQKLEKYQAVIYGSFLSEYYIPQTSDIDIAIITQTREKKDNLFLWRSMVGRFDKKYDIKIFELLPLWLKMEIIDNYQVLFGDLLEISEYFYHYRSIWKDMEHRIKFNRFKSITEKVKLLERRIE
jgi:predicted nucleotidyltransferase